MKNIYHFFPSQNRFTLIGTLNYLVKVELKDSLVLILNSGGRLGALQSRS